MSQTPTTTKVKVATDSDFTNPLINYDNTYTTVLTTTSGQIPKSTLIYSKVQHGSSLGTSSWSPTRLFRIAAYHQWIAEPSIYSASSKCSMIQKGDYIFYSNYYAIYRIDITNGTYKRYSPSTVGIGAICIKENILYFFTSQSVYVSGWYSQQVIAAYNLDTDTMVFSKSVLLSYNGSSSVSSFYENSGYLYLFANINSTSTNTNIVLKANSTNGDFVKLIYSNGVTGYVLSGSVKGFIFPNIDKFIIPFDPWNNTTGINLCGWIIGYLSSMTYITAKTFSNYQDVIAGGNVSSIDNRVAIVGSSSSGGGMLFVILNDATTILFKKSYVISSATTFYFKSVTFDNSGNMIVTGQLLHSSTGSNYCLTIFKIAEDGTIIWAKYIKYNGGNIGTDSNCFVNSDGNIIIGTFVGTSDDGAHARLITIDSSGNTTDGAMVNYPTLSIYNLIDTLTPTVNTLSAIVSDTSIVGYTTGSLTDLSQTVSTTTNSFTKYTY